MIKTFAKNTRGKDYVVGDIHGCFTKLRNALYHIKFDRKNDRLFSVGDLVDRGPESEQCIQFLQKDWFNSIRGNHEEMAIQYFYGRWPEDNYYVNGGHWFGKLNETQQYVYVEEFQKLPYAIEVETDAGLIGIVHAECPINDWNALRDGFRGDEFEYFQENCLWSRNRIQNKDDSIVENVHMIYVGHTPVKNPVVLGNTVYIDTGAVFGRELTILEIS